MHLSMIRKIKFYTIEETVNHYKVYIKKINEIQLSMSKVYIYVETFTFFKVVLYNVIMYDFHSKRQFWSEMTLFCYTKKFTLDIIGTLCKTD